MFRRLLSILPYIVLLGALLLLFQEVRQIEWQVFLSDLLRRPTAQIITAFAILLANYLVLAGYDLTSLRQVGERVPLAVVLKTAFASFALTNVVGHSLITGLSIRFREYQRFGVSLSKVTQVVVLNLEAWWVGFMFLFGAVLVHVPLRGLAWGLSRSLSLVTGIALLTVIAVYLLGCLKMAGRQVRLWRVELHLPDLQDGLTKLLFAALDTACVALQLYALLPTNVELSFTSFLGYYLTALFLSIVSLVPGGIGVFEGLFLHMMAGHGSKSETLASLLVFRAIHFLVPLALTLLWEAVRHMRRPAQA